MSQTVDSIKSSSTVQSMVRFGLVGALGTLIDISLFTGLHVWLGVPTLLANTLSYSAGIINNYLFHRFWTFAGRPRRAAGGQFAQFALVSLIALALNNLIVLLLAQPLGVVIGSSGLGAVLAKICATGIGMIWNFLASHLWIFRNFHDLNDPDLERSL